MFQASRSTNGCIRGALPEKEVMSLGLQLARGLTAAHAQGIIHRDLKPGNLRVTPDNVLKILDFGLAQLFDAPGARTLEPSMRPITLEAPGLAGTPAYMSPEQLDGREPDSRSDIYSAGVVSLRAGDRIKAISATRATAVGGHSAFPAAGAAHQEAGHFGGAGSDHLEVPGERSRICGISRPANCWTTCRGLVPGKTRQRPPKV